MKNIILILLLAISFVSCDSSPDPIYVGDEIISRAKTQEINMVKTLELTPDTVTVAITGDKLLFKDTKNRIYGAKITSGTDYNFLTDGEIIMITLVFFVFGIFIGLGMSN